MKRWFLIFLFLDILFASGAEFLLISPDARGSAMNSLFSLSEGVEGVFWNPANISTTKNMEMLFTHSEWFQNTRYDYFGLTFYKEKVGYIGFSLKGFYSTGIEVRKDTLPSEKKYSVLYTNSNFSYSRKIKDLLLGLNLKVIYGSIYNSSTFSFAGDFGINYPYRFFKFGFVVKNFGLPMKFKDKADPLPLEVGGGIGFSTRTKNINIELGGFYDFPDKWWNFGVGCEYTLWDVLSLRLGYSKNLSDIPQESGFTYGGGIKVFGVNFDYSFIPYGILGHTHRFTLKYNFEILKRRRVSIEKMLKVKAREELRQKEKMVAQTYVESGKKKMESGDLEEAKRLFDIALIWDPENEEAKRLYILVESRIISKKIAFYFLKARECRNKNDYAKSLFYIQEVLKIDPDNPDAKAFRDTVEMLIKEKVKKEFKEEKFEHYFNTGLNFFKKGEYKKAKNYFAKILQIEPQNAQAKYYYNECEKRVENLYSIYYEKGKNLYKEKRYIDAKKLLEKAFHYKSTQEAKSFLSEINAKIREIAEENYNKGLTLFNKGEIEEAYFYFIKARTYTPGDSRINSYIERIEKNYGEKIDVDRIYLKGVEAYVENDLQTAINCWVKVKEINPDYPNLDKNIERARSKLQEIERG